MSAKAIVRQEIEKIPGVTRTWFEWSYEDNGAKANTLVVEVGFDTDPNSTNWDEQCLIDIQKIAVDVLKNKTAMIVSYLRVVPAGIFTA